MGAAPSRESTTLYSYFRGTYEIGLIPLTKAFFGLPGDPIVAPQTKRKKEKKKKTWGLAFATSRSLMSLRQHRQRLISAVQWSYGDNLSLCVAIRPFYTPTHVGKSLHRGQNFFRMPLLRKIWTPSWIRLRNGYTTLMRRCLPTLKMLSSLFHVPFASFVRMDRNGLGVSFGVDVALLSLGTLPAFQRTSAAHLRWQKENCQREKKEQRAPTMTPNTLFLPPHKYHSS
ncbi:hypothetical protein C3747_87g78 [Trypanosoma cruzi]|uniref:Uncharacterized protein n=1 Tax=Trypanosoma cruzi TaxID=5693 RepID=A0A2V2WKL3_TRYCR|nr:hypothetical protein C3747_87g78 [Trypanosoma cruzi]